MALKSVTLATLWLACFLLVSPSAVRAQAPPAPAGVTEHDAVFRNFAFTSGEKLDEVRIHYRTLGTLQKDAQGRPANAVLILHGTGGTGAQFLSPQFAKELFGDGQLLDASKHFLILPDKCPAVPRRASSRAMGNDTGAITRVLCRSWSWSACRV